MRSQSGLRLGAIAIMALGFALGSCSIDNSVGYVEIKTVPGSLAAPFYLDTTKLEPIRNGTAVLRQKVGTAKLQVESDAGPPVLLCNVVVQKNRITSVTISVVSRQLRCQCGRASVSNARNCIA